jgi:hypothetical protein
LRQCEFDASTERTRGNSSTSSSIAAAPADRSHLLERLIASLDTDPEVEEAWELEADRREAALESGSVAEVPAQEAMKPPSVKACSVTYSLHPGAEQDIADGLDFYTEQAGLLVAQRFLDEFERVAKLLVTSSWLRHTNHARPPRISAARLSALCRVSEP